MDLTRHLHSYRASFARDRLEGYEEYASTTPTKHKAFPCVQDYLNTIKKNLLYAMEQGNTERYRHWLTQHQVAMIQVFERMTQDLLHPYGEQDVQLHADFLAEKGWRWFKFHDKSLEFDLTFEGSHQAYRVLLCPRLNHRPKIVEGTGPFDADEYQVFLRVDSPEIQRKCFAHKAAYPDMKMIAPLTYVKSAFVNDGEEIRDWTYPLFE